MTVRRWRVVDPFDTNAQTQTYVFPMNPASMTSPYPERAIATQGTTRGRVLAFEGSSTGKSWEFAGPILDKDHFTALHDWVYGRPGRVVINDHFGRHIDCILQTFDVIPKRRVGYYYSHDYTITALVLGVQDPTIPNAGPGAA